MQKKYIAILACVIGAALAIMATGYLTVLNTSSTRANVAKTNTRIPEFSAKTLDGKDYVHSSEGIVVYEVFAEWCFPCRTSVPHAVAFAKQNPDIDVVGFAFRDVDFKIRDFQKEYGKFSTTIMSTPALEKTLGVTNAPQTLFTYKNRIVYRIYGSATKEDLENVLSLVKGELSSSK